MWILTHILFHLTPLLTISKHLLAMSVLKCKEKDLKGVYACQATQHACFLSIWPACLGLGLSCILVRKGELLCPEPPLGVRVQKAYLDTTLES